ncbi:MAG: serine protease [Bacteroidales bacterium]|nr:serine protease [Bacteroidales bacterium]
MWIIAALIFIGILLMLIEMLLVPGVGVAGFLGLSALAGACVYAFLRVSAPAGIVVTVIVMALLLVMLYFILREKTWKRFELNTEIDSKVGQEQSSVTVGSRGFAQTRLAPMGTARFGDVTCEVKSADNSMIAARTLIEVIAVEDNRILVKTINE